ncbi:MAG: hypothetical protein HOH38_01865 [Nitrospinaceae bacterium]|jgi:hypothetical protein|nr:hypothetical protein [Nitrospina sp.]MBT5867565.1 hypothetical protein [Nitrospinaceae bacterium]
MEYFRNTNFRPIFFLLSLLLGSFCFQAKATAEIDTSVLLTDEEKRWLIDHSEITYSSDPDYPPIEFINSKGQ